MNGKWMRAVGLLAAAVTIAWTWAPPPVAVFDADGSVDFPTTVTVGQTSVAASLTLTSLSDWEIYSSANEVCRHDDEQGQCGFPSKDDGILLVPACPMMSGNSCFPGSEETGVFGLPSTATGRVGTECDGMVFVVVDVTPGTWRFTPQGSAKVLLDDGMSCIIDFTFDVLKLPIDQDPNTPGIQTVQVFRHKQVPGDGKEADPKVVIKTDVVTVLAVPTIATTASGAVLVGGQVHDTAVVSGRADPQPGATVEFRLYGPNDATCANPPVFTSSVAYPVAGGPVSSASFSPVSAGTYRWRALYSGDAANASVSAPCNAPNESVVVSPPANVAITTKASPTVVIGGSVSDQATVTGRVNPQPGGTVTFNLYGPDDVDCSRPPTFTSVVLLPADSNSATSASYVPQAPGNYRWRASYSGDSAGNPAVSAPCNAPDESVYVTQKPTTVSTTASPSIVIGAGQLTDTAVVLGRSEPRSASTVTFHLYGPDDPTCSRPIFESADVLYPIAGGPVVSGAFTPTVAGTYRWRAFYGGDVTNAPSTDVCDAPSERVVVMKATPALNNTPGPDIILGENLTGIVVIGGLVNPQLNSSVSIFIYGPSVTGGSIQNEAACSGFPVFERSNVPYLAAGTLVTASFTPTVTGTYGWRAVYHGDVNNAAVTSACSAVNVRAVAEVPDIAAGGVLPATGSDTSGLLALAAGTIAAGLLLMFAGVRRRHHPA